MRLTSVISNNTSHSPAGPCVAPAQTHISCRPHECTRSADVLPESVVCSGTTVPSAASPLPQSHNSRGFLVRELVSSERVTTAEAGAAHRTQSRDGLSTHGVAPCHCGT